LFPETLHNIELVFFVFYKILLHFSQHFHLLPSLDPILLPFLDVVFLDSLHVVFEQVVSLLNFLDYFLFLLFCEFGLLFVQINLTLFLKFLHEFVHVLDVGEFLVPQLVVVFQLRGEDLLLHGLLLMLDEFHVIVLFGMLGRRGSGHFLFILSFPLLICMIFCLILVCPCCFLHYFSHVVVPHQWIAFQLLLCRSLIFFLHCLIYRLNYQLIQRLFHNVSFSLVSLTTFWTGLFVFYSLPLVQVD
jgi:hypothetical protein